MNANMQGKAPSEGSASTGSTKSATMELYTSSYNETMSGGGETLSSISEKSCISNPNNQGSGSQAFPTQAYLMEDNLPYSRSTYLIDPPTSFEQQQQRYSNTFSNGSSVVRAFAPVEDPMSLYSVVHKDRKVLQSNQSDSPCSIEHQTMNYEDTESEYASELRRQTYLQKIGEHGGYSRNSHHPSVSSVYSTLPHVQMVSASNGYPVRISNGVRLSATELDLDTYSPSLTTPIVIETNQQNTNEGPICASSPKRSMSAFTTFGQNRSNVTTPMSPTGPASGHLV